MSSALNESAKTHGTGTRGLNNKIRFPPKKEQHSAAASAHEQTRHEQQGETASKAVLYYFI
jgi:hypothetical protein